MVWPQPKTFLRQCCQPQRVSSSLTADTQQDISVTCHGFTPTASDCKQIRRVKLKNADMLRRCTQYKTYTSNVSGCISKQSFTEKKNVHMYIESSFSPRIQNALTPPNTPIYLNCNVDLFEAKLMACWVDVQQEETVLSAIWCGFW